MLLPLALALVTAMALVVVIAPLMKGLGVGPPRLDFDRAVYRDQLGELERDRARGLIGEREAEISRIEIERRLLTADRADRAPPREGRALPIAAAIVALVLAAGAGGLYAFLGSPGVPDEPASSRVAAGTGATDDLEKAAQSLEDKVRANPNDTESWAALARAEANLRDWQKSVDAYTHAVTLAPERSDLVAALGEAETFAADGVVTPKAAADFKKALAGDPTDGVARYYLALADAQAGKTDAAIAAWQKMAAESPADAPVRAELKRRIDETAKEAGIAPPPLAPPAAAAAETKAPPGPDAGQMAAAANMTPEARQQMIRGMVDKLAADLKAKPDDRDGWVRLARSYSVLGERDKSADAYEQAAKLDPKNVDIKLGEVDALLDGNALEQPIPPRVVTLLHDVEAQSPQEPEVLWYLGLAAAQAKAPDQAASYWNRLLAALPQDAPERKTVAAALAALKK
ncbi:MAG TPA: c-type cytochrome biogenesis protein CcmI [Stellaceae bacterium]|nr:c-type cytochrome biogenesis protein CcmI [Stellaceae bacterium]